MYLEVTGKKSLEKRSRKKDPLEKKSPGKKILGKMVLWKKIPIKKVPGKKVSEKVFSVKEMPGKTTKRILLLLSIDLTHIPEDAQYVPHDPANTKL